MFESNCKAACKQEEKEKEGRGKETLLSEAPLAALGISAAPESGGFVEIKALGSIMIGRQRWETN